jgi:hypothetical protein
MRWTFAVLLVTTFPALAQHWEFEQVDTAGNWSDLQLRQGPTGTLYCCYIDQESDSVLLATLDTVWQKERVTQSSFACFDVGRSGRIGVLCEEGCFLKTDTGWTTIPIPFGSRLLAIDSSGRPGCVRRAWDINHEYLVLHEWTDTAWTSDTAFAWPFQYRVYPGDFTYDVEDQPRVLARTVVTSDGLTPLWGSNYADLFTKTPSHWETQVLDGGRYAEAIRVYDVAASPAQGVSCCWWSSIGSRFACDSMVVDTGAAPNACRVCSDSCEVRHLAYFAADGRLIYATNADTWRREVILGPPVLALGGIARDGERPVVALIAADSTIQLARRYAAGVLERQVTTRTRGNCATVARGCLFLPGRPGHQTLFSFMGRHVEDLHPGPNDIRHLSPGIYFIREESARTTRKVIVTR